MLFIKWFLELLHLKVKDIIKNQLDEPKIRAQEKILPPRIANKLTWDDIKWIKSKVNLKYQKVINKTQ